MTRRQHANKFRWRVGPCGTCGMGKLCYRVWCWCGAGRDSGNCGERIRQIVEKDTRRGAVGRASIRMSESVDGDLPR